MWLIGQLNWELLFDDDIYALEHFLIRFSAWTGYQIRGAPQLARSKRPTPEETGATLARARELLMAAIKDVDGLEKLNLERGTTQLGPPPTPLKPSWNFRPSGRK